ncbi:MAG: TlpA family protein disulfide reductase [Candidatus Neomarinimicrobiota bacterium]
MSYKFLKFLILLILFSSCSKVELIPVTSHELKKMVEMKKGSEAVLLNVWALWCVPCVEEFPMIVELGNKYDNLDVIFISADFQEQFNAVLSFLGKNGVNQTSYIKNEKDEPFILGLDPKWTGSLPFTIVYAKSTGKVIDSWEGIAPESKFKAAIVAALEI